MRLRCRAVSTAARGLRLIQTVWKCTARLLKDEGSCAPANDKDESSAPWGRFPENLDGEKSITPPLPGTPVKMNV